MSITSEKKTELIGEFGRSEGDTGGSDVQVAILTSRIRTLTEHLQVHKKDHAARRGLLKLVGRRSALLKYVKRHDYERYMALIGKLGVRGK